MANYFVTGWTCIALSPTLEQGARAQQIIDRVRQELDALDVNGSCDVTVMGNLDVTLGHGEDFSPERAQAYMQALADELPLLPHTYHECTWAYTCSKADPNGFGGGCLIVTKGAAPVLIDAYAEAREHIKKREQRNTCYVAPETAHALYLAAKDLVDRAHQGLPVTLDDYTILAGAVGEVDDAMFSDWWEREQAEKLTRKDTTRDAYDTPPDAIRHA
jgi:hypothetical protein